MNKFNTSFFANSDNRDGVWDEAVNDEMLWYSREDHKHLDIKSLLSDINDQTVDELKNFIIQGDGIVTIELTDDIELMIHITKVILSGKAVIVLNFIGNLDKYAVSKEENDACDN